MSKSAFHALGLTLLIVAIVVGVIMGGWSAIATTLSGLQGAIEDEKVFRSVVLWMLCMILLRVLLMGNGRPQ